METAARVGDAQEARWLCQRAAGRDTTEWALGLDDRVTQRAMAHLDAMLARRATGEPLQYVLGGWGFRTLDLFVDRRVLIPRPETEQVVEVALALVRRRPRPWLAADLGTGSGAIALALAAELPIGSVEVWATDVSPDALAVARANLAGLGRPAAAVRIAEGSWFEALPADLEGRFDLLVSNPPYVAAHEVLPEEVAAWEPRDALVSGPTGFEAVEVLVGGATRWLAPGGWLVVEIGATQGPGARARAESADLADVDVLADAAGRDRVLVARRP